MNLRQDVLTSGILIAALSISVASGADRPPRVPTDLIDQFAANVPAPAEKAGVGIGLALRDGRLYVFRVLPGSPAALCGSIHAGDRLVAVGQGNQPTVDVSRMSINKAVSLLRGQKGTPVILTMIPAGKADADAIVITLIRGVIKELNVFGDGRPLPPGTKAPGFEAILLPGGGKYALKESRGKIVVVEFWASWCAPCLGLLDHFQELTKQHPQYANRVQFVAIGVDEDKERALHCFQGRGKSWSGLTVVWAGPQLLKLFHIGGLPGIYLLDRQGAVIAADPKLDLPTAIEKALTAASDAHRPK
jgi:thiol-disulfide isomerase/thioredoxin